MEILEDWRLGIGVLRKILGPMRGEVTADSRKLHCEELSSYLTSVVKSSVIGWTGHVARMGRKEMHIEKET
jgi:hypothetical protein